jgi:D-alanyl-D-alanine dipeptidase
VIGWMMKYEPLLLIVQLTIFSMAELLCQAPDAVSQAAENIPSQFAYLREIDPSVLQDVRYAGNDNFTGQPVPGYAAAECILLRSVAEALKRVQADLLGQSFSLKVYDCYRPKRAVKTFVDWAKDASDNGKTKRFYPSLQKSELLQAGYISAASVHSRGIAVDLTVVKVPPAPQASFDLKASYGPCTGPVEQRSPDNSIDMGTGFDCFDLRSHTGNMEILAEQRRSRDILVTAMERRQFKNYAREWWHFTYQMSASSALQAYDFPVVVFRGVTGLVR